eukprot:Skav228066  [mRNA]  locus=scaffold2067:317288:317533:- [translate_table: standard]
MSPEHICLWMIEQLTQRIATGMRDGNVRKVERNTARRQIMVQVFKICRRDPSQRHRAMFMLTEATHVSSDEDDDDEWGDDG